MTQQTTQPTAQETLELKNKMETRAHALLNAMVKHEYRNAIVHFDSNMSSLLPTPKVEELWAAILTKGGAFVEQTSVRTVVNDAGQPIVILVCKFEKGTADIFVTFDLAGNVSGLHVGPDPAASAAAKAAETAAPVAKEPPPAKPVQAEAAPPQ